MNFRFLCKILICFSLYCSDDDLSNYIHIDYIKRYCPNLDLYALRKNAIRDGHTAPYIIFISKEVFEPIAKVTVGIGFIYFFVNNSDKIEKWINAVISQYPEQITIDNGSSGGVTFGVPYYVFIPSIFLTYLIAKKHS